MTDENIAKDLPTHQPDATPVDGKHNAPSTVLSTEFGPFSALTAAPQDAQVVVGREDDRAAADVVLPQEQKPGVVGGISEPATMDVLCGRGAGVNAHLGNKRFRALCFSRKPMVRNAATASSSTCNVPNAHLHVSRVVIFNNRVRASCSLFHSSCLHYHDLFDSSTPVTMSPRSDWQQKWFALR
jgi:hypothetical protein